MKVSYCDGALVDSGMARVGMESDLGLETLKVVAPHPRPLSPGGRGDKEASAERDCDSRLA